MALAADSTANYIPIETIYGRQNKDGTYTLTALDIKRLNDNLYNIVRKIQGGLTFSDLTSEAGSEISEKVTFTDLSTGGSTVINGDNITTGTISANRIATNIAQVNKAVNIGSIGDSDDKTITFSGTAFIKNDDNGYGGAPLIVISSGAVEMSDIVTSGIIKNYSSSFPIRIHSDGANMSLDSGGTIYIGSNTSYSNAVQIGRAGSGSRIDIYGDVYVNGVQI